MKMHELLFTPDKWTQRAEARLPSNTITFYNDPNATCWCITGAIYKCYPDDKERWDAIIQTIIHELYPTHNFFGPAPIQCWNDHPNRTHEEVLNLLKTLGI